MLRGGGSALFGSSAIGGTINIITREPSRSSAQLSHTLTSLGGSNSYDNATMLNASIVSESGRAGISVFGQSRHRSGYDHDGDGFTRTARHQQPVGRHALVFPHRGLFAHHGAVSPTSTNTAGGDLLDPASARSLRRQSRPTMRLTAGSLSFDLSSADRSKPVHTSASFQNTARKSYYGGHRTPTPTVRRTT